MGHAVMTSATYPNHATFATGVEPLVHGLLANWIVDGSRATPVEKVGPKGPTIFDACRAAGRSTAAVVGDQHLIKVMGALTADMHWPPDGELTDDIARDGHGYAADREVVPRLLHVLEGDRPDLVVAHLNETDTAAHIHGPDSEGALAAYRSADDSVAAIVDVLRSTWDDTVLVVVSDHDQENVDEPIDLYPAAAATGLPLLPIPEGTAAVVWGDDPTSGAWLDDVDGVTGHRELRSGVRLVACAERRWFSPPEGFLREPYDRGTHGGERTRAQVAIVAGGSTRVPDLPRRMSATAWAGILAGLLGVHL